MNPLVCAFLLSFAAGLRALVALAALCLACAANRLNLTGTPLAFLGNKITAGIAVALGLFELVNDKLPKTPSRLIPAQFGARVAIGILVGFAFGLAHHTLLASLVVSVAGAVAGTLAGARLRRWLTAVLKNDLFAALIEDALCLALVLVSVG